MFSVRPRHRLQAGHRRADARPDQHPTFTINGGTRQGAEALMLQEWHYFFENTRRWRNLRKITIAQVHGDRVRRRADAHVGVRPDRRRRGHQVRRRGRHPPGHVRRRVLRPPVGVRAPQDQGAHAHRRLASTPTRPTSSAWSARSSPPTELAERTLEFARRIAQLPTMTAC